MELSLKMLSSVHSVKKNGIFHNFSSPRRPRQNGVVQRKNRTLQEIARTMLCENLLPKQLWEEAINTTCYAHNRILIISLIKKTPYAYREEEDPAFYTFIHLDVSVLSSTLKINLLSLI